MKSILITATNTDIGKTYTSLKLIEELSNRSFKVGVFKPIETGVQTIGHDAQLLFESCLLYNKSFKNIDIEDVVPITYKLPAAPFVSKGKGQIDFSKIDKAFKKLSNYCDILLIESAGGLLTPIEIDYYMIDLANYFKVTSTLLITDEKLGCINNTLLSMEALKSRNIPFTWCVNIKDNSSSFEQVTLPYFQDKFGKVLSVQENIKEIINNLLSLE